MNDKVHEIFSKVKASASSVGEILGDTARQVGKAAGDTIETARLNMKIFDLNTEINVIFKKLGKLLYGVHTGDAEDSAAVDLLLAEIDSKKAEIVELKERIAEYKSSVACPKCHALCPKTDKFCKNCGMVLK